MYSYCDMWTKFILTSFFRFLWEFNENDESEEKKASQSKLPWSFRKEPKESKKDKPEEAVIKWKESTDQDETEKNRKEQEQEAKKRKREEEKKKREAKQQQWKEQLLALQNQHQRTGKHRSSKSSSSASDNEYLPISVDEGFTDSEHEENVHMASKQPRKSRETSAPGSSQLTNSTVPGRDPHLLQT